MKYSWRYEFLEVGTFFWLTGYCAVVQSKILVISNSPGGGVTHRIFIYRDVPLNRSGTEYHFVKIGSMAGSIFVIFDCERSL